MFDTAILVSVLLVLVLGFAAISLITFIGNKFLPKNSEGKTKGLSLKEKLIFLAMLVLLLLGFFVYFLAQFDSL